MVLLHAAGNYFGNNTGQNITFPPGSSAGDEACASTMIYSDGVLEVSEATVNVEVFPRQFSHVSVSVEQRFARVTIVDANGKQFPWDVCVATTYRAGHQKRYFKLTPQCGLVH